MLPVGLKGVRKMQIAYRRLITSSASGDIDVPIRLFKPEENDGAWICRYEIEWPDQKHSGFAAGADSIQALVLALQRIGVEIYTSAYHKTGSLKWPRSAKGYGFPIARNLRDLLIGDDADL
jgi:hypothetical protein